MKISNLFIGILLRLCPGFAGAGSLNDARLRGAAGLRDDAGRPYRRIANSSANPALPEQADYALATR